HAPLAVGRSHRLRVLEAVPADQADDAVLGVDAVLLTSANDTRDRCCPNRLREDPLPNGEQALRSQNLLVARIEAPAARLEHRTERKLAVGRERGGKRPDRGVRNPCRAEGPFPHAANDCRTACRLDSVDLRQPIDAAELPEFSKTLPDGAEEPTPR